MELILGKNIIILKESLFYSKVHNWVDLNEDVATIGLTDYAQAEMGEISMVELMERSLPGTELSQVKFQGNFPSSAPIPDVTIESAKTVSQLYSPLSGKVISVNSELCVEPERVNLSPYERGWLITLEPTKIDQELCNLMDYKEYAQFLKSLY
ncbi:Glycine cleavage system H protein [Candidatus Lokiarchaeum ossiferum]|uniref:Glycine cleavage system H protein n=1 Tax=Candidatus Lokiarchaeum ossiferum TaxID=2951803 RepID=A0ABY6HXX6_9ARCH|nr:Glycine cleavage system H protein [Candidatus Lokiarchaeum sp. B-35]